MSEVGGSGRDELKRQPPPSPAVLWIMNIRERKHREKTKQNKKRGNDVAFDLMRIIFQSR